MNAIKVKGVASIDQNSLDATAPITSFASWLEPHLPVLTAVAIREVGGDNAYDLVQDTSTRAWQQRSNYRPDRGTPRVWLLTLLMDQARRRRVRHARHKVIVLTDALPDAPADSDDNDLRVLRLDVENSVANLPRRHREVVILYYLAGLTIH